ncbi:hypothetical protein RI129_006189 [Pyrocoelia pectoralis]|uniref:PSP proline-rich domain-containing protein n=1 Tax=Pyrocoelia pectoralis TaxID=417401 RepID=A0AAN7VEV9_9COLE
MENSNKKVHNTSQETVIELSDDDCVLDISCGSEDIQFLEPSNNTPLHEVITTSQSYDSGVEFISQSSDVASQDIIEPDIDSVIPPHESDVHSQEANDTTIVIDVIDSVSQDSKDAIILVDEKEEVTSHETNTDKQRLLQLEEEVQQLKAANESLKLKTCSCHNTQDALITIRFDTLSSFITYKEKICKLFDEYVNLERDEQENNLLIRIYNDRTINANEWVVIDELEATLPLEDTLPLDKRKKRRKRKLSLEECDNLKDMFILDTTPSLTTKNSLRYESKFDIVSFTNKNDEGIPKGTSNMCFNCDGAHNLRDCTQPKNHFKINAARQKFKPQNKTNFYMRYHLKCDQRFEDFKPGKISSKLQEALGLRYNQLPEHIYRMRKLGYPPGWFNEFIASKESNLVLFDFNGKDASEQKKMVQDLDVNKIIDYHGFNVPLQKGFKDEHRLYDSPPYSKELSKSKMMTFLNKFNKDNLNSCDMEIDNVSSDKEVEVLNVLKEDKPDPVHVATSPTLVELEKEKEKLLEQLTEDVNSNSFIESKNDISNAKKDVVIIDEIRSIEPDSTIQSEINGTVMEDDSKIEKLCDSPILKTIKTSYFGTPILKSASPFSHLPHSDNFTKNVSDIINFENLPNSTGKYEQMVGVIEKVRKTLNNKK